MTRTLLLLLFSPLFSLSIAQNALPGTCNLCGGATKTTCPGGLTCVDDPNDQCDPEKGGVDCIGICMEPLVPTIPPRTCLSGETTTIEGECDACGGEGNIQCDSGLVCADDPNDDCSFLNALDCMGLCVPIPRQPRGVCRPCGGEPPRLCGKGLTCINDPNFPCDPNYGPCPGICLKL